MKTCPNCGTAIEDSDRFCTHCGATIPMQTAAPAANETFAQAAPGSPQQPNYPPQQSYQQPVNPPYQQPAAQSYPAAPQQIPMQYRPLSPWAYFGYSLLFSIPVLGFILLLVFSFSNENINRRNYARSFFIGFILVLIISIIIGVLAATGAIAFGSLSAFDEIFTSV